MKFCFLYLIALVSGHPAYATGASPFPCGYMALELEPKIHQKLIEMGVSHLEDELQAIRWTISKTSDGRIVIIRQSYIASSDGFITNELIATGECDTSTNLYKLMDVRAVAPLVKLKLAY